jgi:hypothetical protein
MGEDWKHDPFWELMGILRFSRTIALSTTFLTPTTVAAEGALALLDGETDGFAIDATHYDDFTGYAYPAYVGGPVGGTVAVIDTGTPANDLTDVPLDASNLVNSGTSPKMVHFPSSPYVRWSPHNIAIQSQTLGNASWTKSGATVTDNAATAPDGTSTADEVIESATNAPHNVYQTLSTNIVNLFTYTWSIYCKANTRSFVALQLAIDASGNDRYTVVFDLSNGTVSDTTTKGVLAGAANSITSVGSGWYRCAVTATVEDTTIYPVVALSNSGTPSYDGTSYLPTYNGDGTSGAYFWGAQLNRGTIATPYLATTTAARIGIPQSYDIAEAQYGILVEPAATNLCLYSDDFTNAAWTKSNMTTAKTATGPDAGANSASTLTATAGNATALQAITSGSSARITGFWVKRRTGSGNIDLTQDNGSTWQTMTVTADWTRVELTAATLANPTVGIRIVTNTDAVDVFGFQHEVGSVLTSTIPTVGSTVTRATDNVDLQVSTIPDVEPAVSMYMQMKPARVNVASAGYWAQGKDATHFNFLGDGAGQVQWQIYDGTQQAQVLVGTLVANTATKLAASADTNSFNVAKDGVAGTRDTTGSVSTAMTEIELGGATITGAGPQSPLLIYYLVTLPRTMDDTELVTKST